MSFYAIRYGYQPYTMPRGRSSRLQRIILRSGYGQPFDNLTADHGHIEGSTDDMRHKAQLPNGKWVSADSTQQLVDTALAQMAPPQQPAAAPLLENYIQEWFQTYMQPKLRGTTAKGYLSGIRHHIIPFFAGKRMDEISRKDIQEFLTERKSYARSTLHTLKIILQEVFDSAIEDGIVTKNPAASKRLTLSDKVTERQEVQPEHMREILTQLDRLQPRDRCLLSILIYTGMRRGEALALRWENIDIANGLIHITQAVTYSTKDGNKPQLGKTKSKAGEREIPLFPELRDLLVPLRQLSGFIICNGTDGQPLTQSAYNRTWERIGKAIPVIKANAYTPHQFRHSFLSSAAAMGLDPKTLQAIAGHSDIRVTMNRYVHSRHDQIIEAGNKCYGMFLEHTADG